MWKPLSEWTIHSHHATMWDIGKTGMNINIVYDMLSILQSSMVTPVLGLFILKKNKISSRTVFFWCDASSQNYAYDSINVNIFIVFVFIIFSSCNPAITCVNRLSNAGNFPHGKIDTTTDGTGVGSACVVVQSRWKATGLFYGFYSPPGDRNDFHPHRNTNHSCTLAGECEPAAHAAPPPPPPRFWKWQQTLCAMAVCIWEAGVKGDPVAEVWLL